MNMLQSESSAPFRENPNNADPIKIKVLPNIAFSPFWFARTKLNI